MGTAEVESALVAHPKVAEAAVVGFPHDLKGQGIYAYVTLNAGEEPTEALRKELVAWVRQRDRADRLAGRDPVGAGPAEDAQRQDHAPHPAQDRRQRDRRAGRYLDAGRSGGGDGTGGEPGAGEKGRAGDTSAPADPRGNDELSWQPRRTGPAAARKCYECIETRSGWCGWSARSSLSRPIWIGPDRFLHGTFGVLLDLQATLQGLETTFRALLAGLTVEAFELIRALAIGLFVVFLALGLMAARRGLRARAALVVLTVLYLVLLYPAIDGDYVSGGTGRPPSFWRLWAPW